MQIFANIRMCATCNKPLPWSEEETGQCGWYCCEEYFCSEDCLDKSFDNPDVSDEDRLNGWEGHYTDDGDCYYTDWELEEVKEEL